MIKDLNAFYSERNRALISIITIIAGLCFTLAFFLRISLDDAYFWYYNTPYYKELFMECGFMIFGNLFRSYCVDSILAFRILGWLCGIACVSIPYITLLSREDQKKNLMYLGACLFIICYMTDGYFCPDSITALLFVSTATIMLKKDEITIKQIILIGLLSGLSVTARFPNILCIPAIIIYLLFCSSKNRWAMISVYCSIAFTSYYLLIACIYNDFNYVRIVQNTLANTSSSSDKSHQISFLIQNYLIDIFNTLKAAGPIIFVLLFIESYKRLSKRPIVKYVIVFFTTILFLHFIGKGLYSPISYNQKVFSFIVIFFLLLYWHKNKKRVSLIKLSVIIFIGFVACAGSNMGIMKISPFFPAIAPVVIVLLNKQRILPNTHIVCIFSICAFSILCCIRDKYPHCSWSGKGKWNTSLQDYHYPICKNGFVGLYEKEDYKRVTKEIDLYEKFGIKDHTFIYGNPSAHEMYGIIDSKIPYYIPYYMAKDDKVAINKLLQHFESDSQSVLFDFSDSEIIEMYMQNKGHKKIHSEEKLIIYKKS